MNARRHLAAVLGRPRAEDGFTIIEVLVAALVLTLGAAAVLMTLVAGIRNVQRGKQTQVAVKVAQREMEKVRSLGYGEVTMSALPNMAPSLSSSPDHRVLSGGTQFDLARGEGSVDAAPICSEVTDPCVGEGPARVTRGPTDTCVDGTAGGRFRVGDTEGQVYCYVTSVGDPACEPEGALCVKRVVVAVWLDKPPNATYRSSYYELQSDFVDTAS